MAGPRLTAPVARQLVRSISTTHAQAVPKSTTLITSSKTTAPLMRKYAELLKERNLETDGRSREFTTRSANRPHPPPKRMRLMQTLNPSASYSQAAASTQGNVDATFLPSFDFMEASAANSSLRVPLLPDNYSATHAPEAADAPLAMPEISIVAAHPETVSPSALTEVEGMTMDGIELKFAHENSASSSAESSYSEQGEGMIKGIWNGLLDDVFGESSKQKSKLAV
ncbi:hypothetical protein PG994_004579 [Apiospora phragmitis]|uniref:Uncharacterized protein n=1 Tax=Apiospora phragmitis TaxID=2905665 RepID=A0ABR1VQZ6_9PEZI